MTTYIGVATLAAEAFNGTGNSTKTAFYGSGPAIVVFASSTGIGYAAIYGQNANGLGVYGYGASHSGVFGEGAGNYVPGILGRGWYGVQGSSTSASGTGVYGYSGVSGAYAAYFSGPTYVSGDLTVTGTKSFLIDHPLDPENRVLQHACVESPERKNVYDGIVTADATGECQVALPAYFEALNEEFRYQLTALGGAAPGLHVKREINDRGEFLVAGAGPGQRVSWQVTGTRKDPAAKVNPLIVEREKRDDERGYYLHPAAFGHAPERGIDSRRHPTPAAVFHKPAGHSAP